MATTSKSIKCSKCNVFTTDADYCNNCGELISFEKKQEIKEQILKQEMIDEEQFKIDNPNWVTRLKKHPFIVYRFFGYLLYSVIFVVSAVGSLLAWFIAMIAAS